MKQVLWVLFYLISITVLATAQTDRPMLLQKPTLSRTQIVFVYAGDLWIVSRDGGDASRLTTGVGIETDPAFSPDGKTVAFTGEYDGNTDIYVVPASGGVPRRLTFHPGVDEVVGWTPDGKRLLFRSARNSTSSYDRLFTVSVEGGFPEEMPLPTARDGSFSPDGSRIAYQPLTQRQPDWKNYRGGQTSRIWIANLSDSNVEELPRQNSNDFDPMWVEGGIFFLSDRQGSVTLYNFELATKKTTQLIHNESLDIKSASAGPGAIIYEQFGAIHLYDLKSGKAKQVDIRVAGDLASVRPHYENVGWRLANGGLSPSGARAVFEARGEIITVPAEKGEPRNLTNTTGVMERDPAWSPDGRWIAYFSDESGEYSLHLCDQSGRGDVKKITLGDPPSFYYSPTWSPDSAKIAYYDKRLILWYVEIDKGKPLRVDKNPDGLRTAVMEPFWSPDSQWLGYTKQVDNHFRALFVYWLATGKSHQLTDGMSDVRYGAFDKSGKYLYFTASTNLGPAVSFAEMSTIPHQSTRSVYAIVLRNDLPSPLAPESDEEMVREERKEEISNVQKAGEIPDEKKPDHPPAVPGEKRGKRAPNPVRIDLDGIDQRIIALPIPSRNYTGLAAGKANTIFILELPPGGTTGGTGSTLHRFDLEKRKLDKLLDGVSGFGISDNGEKLLYRQRQNWFIASTAAAPRSGEGLLSTGDLEVYTDPKNEWRQMFNEALRAERDFFYDPGLHGANIEELKKIYEPYLSSVAHRSDLSYLFREMLNQIRVGHIFVGGGDRMRPNAISGGLLGCDFKIENGRYRFAKIYNGDSWNPQLRAPLTQPGVNVKEEEYLLAVKGRELRATDNVYALFEGTANKQTVIRVGLSADGSNSREVTVVPLASETALRNLDWIESNRRMVDRLSNGRLAYIYVPDTGGNGYNSFNRYFFAQTQKRGAVIDERFNTGGALADYIVEYLNRPLLNFIAFREGRDVPTPLGAIYGPKAMIVNEFAGSGGDALPWYFRKMNIGPVIGERTWGGLVAGFLAPQLMDGGSITAPDAAVYGLSGEWEVENHGVAPDIEVQFDPAAWRQGRDPQLEKAVEVLLEELTKNHRPEHSRPGYPNYHKGKTGSNK